MNTSNEGFFFTKQQVASKHKKHECCSVFKTLLKRFFFDFCFVFVNRHVNYCFPRRLLLARCCDEPYRPCNGKKRSFCCCFCFHLRTRVSLSSLFCTFRKSRFLFLFFYFLFYFFLFLLLLSLFSS